jgi:hypothetical protein
VQKQIYFSDTQSFAMNPSWDRPPLSCWKLNVQPWIEQLLPSEVSGFMIRDDYMDVTLAAIKYFRRGDKVSTDPRKSDAQPLQDAQVPIINPFLENGIKPNTAPTVATTTAFIVLGQPGIGKEYSFISVVFR